MKIRDIAISLIIYIPLVLMYTRLLPDEFTGIIWQYPSITVIHISVILLSFLEGTKYRRMIFVIVASIPLVFLPLQFGYFFFILVFFLSPLSVFGVSSIILSSCTTFSKRKIIIIAIVIGYIFHVGFYAFGYLTGWPGFN